MISFRKKIDYESIIYVCSSLETYISAGIQFLAAIELIESGLTNKLYKESLRRISKRITEGELISQAFLEEEELYTNIFTDMLVIAEESGEMEAVLKNILEHFEKKYKINKEVNSALLYPKFIMLAIIGVIILFFEMILPSIASMYDSLDVKTSFLTKCIINLNSFFEKYNLYVFLIIVVSIITIVVIFIKKMLKGKNLFAKLNICKRYRELNFIYILSLIVRSGIPIVYALERLSHSVNDPYTRDSIIKITNKLKKGDELIESLNEVDVLSDVSKSFILSGEKSGSLDKVIIRLVNILENNFEKSIKKLTKKIEPITLCVLGVMVLGLMLMVFVPMYEYMNYV